MNTVRRLIWILLALTAGPVCAESTVVPLTDGATLVAIVDLPTGEGKFPAVVLAPGQGYHMALPALEVTARSLATQGIAVIRFNWSYFSAVPKGDPSPDLMRELQELQAAIAFARRHPRIDANRLAVGGKSLGSLVAWRAFALDSQLRSALLLTPVCSRVRAGEQLPKSEAIENYPAADTEQRPTLWISGNRDPLCATRVLYRFAAGAHSALRIATVGGDHSYENRALPAALKDADRSRNLSAIVGLATAFLVETTLVAP